MVRILEVDSSESVEVLGKKVYDFLKLNPSLIKNRQI